MSIVNAGQLEVYEEIDPELRELVEDVLLNRRQDATERLVDYAEKIKDQGEEKSSQQKDAWREESVEERIKHAMVKGIVEYIEADVEVARQKYPHGIVVIVGAVDDSMGMSGCCRGTR